MILIHETNDCKLIRHDRYTGKYKDNNGEFANFQLSEKLFNNFRVKRKIKCSTNNCENTDAKRIEEFLKDCKLKNIFSTYHEDEIDGYKTDNINFMNEFYKLAVSFNEFHGENSLEHGHITEIDSEKYLIPPKCKFFNKPIGKINEFLDPSEKFDYIVIDPPFKCKYIKRLKKTCHNKSYQMMTNQEILEIPVQNYTHKNSIIVIWCTNSDMHEKFIKEDVMNGWNLKLITIWKWVKIDKSGETFCSFNGSKKPYEKIFVATHLENDLELNLPHDLMLFSQPSSIHSHKPPLTDLFHHLLPSEPKCLEIFARSLYKNFTSIGLECLKLQNLMLFDCEI